MPVSMDEMGDTDQVAMAGIVSAVANGASRTRATKDGGLVNSAPWALIALLATNKSARDMINATNNESNAIQYRLLEIDVDNMPEFSADTRETFADDWADVLKSAGALGAMVHLAICRTGAQAISDMVRANVNAASRVIQSVQGDRFQYRGLGALMTMQQLLERIGMSMFDTAVLVDTFRECHAGIAEYIQENVLSTNGLELLSKMLHDMHPYTVITASETRRNARVTKYDEPIGRMPDEVKARHVVDAGCTFITSEAIREWCAKHRVRQADVLHAARTAGVQRHIYRSSVTAAGNESSQWSSNKNLLTGMRASTNAQVKCQLFSTAVLSQRLGIPVSSLDDMIASQMGTVIDIREKAA